MREGQKSAVAIVVAMLIATICLAVAAYKVMNQMEDFYHNEIQYPMSLGTLIFFSLGMKFIAEEWVKR